jgi:hypothetical protein
MKNFEQLNDYLSGIRYNNGLSIRWDLDRQLISRLDYLTDICRDKKVIHLGCLDHNMETITKKIADNTWLHKRLTDVAVQCLGIDIEPSLIDKIKDLGITNAICSDLATDNLRTEITSYEWDYMVCGEIIEHIDNPVSFLSAVRDKYAPFIKNIIVTVPNSLNLGHIKRAFKTVESINTDHRYSFTPYNISKILVISGYCPKEIRTVLHFDPRTRGPVHRFLLKRYPLLRSDIIVTASF